MNVTYSPYTFYDINVSDFSAQINHTNYQTVGPGRRARGARMPLELQLAWAGLFTGMVFVAVAGNLIVIWSVFAHRRMRTVTNYFLVNLSLSDLLMSTFNCLFNFVYMVNKYLAIITPLKPRMSKANAQLAILAIWAASLLLATPCLLYSTTITHKPSGQTACTLLWPDGQPLVSTLDYIYNLVLFLVTYVVPMTAMVCCYSAMGRELWGSRSIGELTQRQLDSIKSKRKVVGMLLVIVLVFGLCWLPYHGYFLCAHHWPALVYTRHVQHVYLAFYWLAMSNAMLNPLIYYSMNHRFREYFRKAVCEWRCQLWSRQSLTQHLDGAETPPIRRFSHSYSRLWLKSLGTTTSVRSKVRGTLEDGSVGEARGRIENGRLQRATPLQLYTALQPAMPLQLYTALQHRSAALQRRHFSTTLSTLPNTDCLL
ncbi:tachykinin-like peptides receptor 86C isoform X4 [Rhodnius prolixus]|uniref:tachykinin-like peptides receptor 86C isoform X4 n=1 Tax=Rhodnius prolixus TaxID=13249 RepID=UPI003D188BF8